MITKESIRQSDRQMRPRIGKKRGYVRTSSSSSASLAERTGNHEVSSMNVKRMRTRPDTRLPQSRACGQGPYLRSIHHLGMSSEAKERKNPKKVKCDGPTDGPTKRGVESRSTRLKKLGLKLNNQIVS